MTQEARVSDEGAPGLPAADPEVAREEARLRAEGPGKLGPDAFWCLLLPAARSTHDGIEALGRWVQGFLQHARLPQRLWAWVTLVGEHRAFFVAADPPASSWAEGEHLQRWSWPSDYVLVTHSHARDELAFRAGDEFGSCQHTRRDGFLSSEALEALVPQGENGVRWLLEQRTALTLADLQRAIGQGDPIVIVHETALVARGPER